MNNLTIQVQENLSVQVLPNTQHEFLMTTNEVANGYDCSTSAIRLVSHRNPDEFISGKHYLKNNEVSLHFVTKPKGGRPTTLWTKRGIIRLGFFIKSKRAKQFRDWAEDLIIFASEQTSIEQRINNLEQRFNNIISLPQNLDDSTPKSTDLKSYFKRYLNRGDLSKIAQDTGYAYRYLQAVKLQNKKSKVIESLLLEKCRKNRLINIELNAQLQS